MNSKWIVIIALILSQGSGFAQQTIEQVLKTIETNNKTLSAVKKEVEAQIMVNSTGLTLENPQVNVDYMIGRPVSAGNQTDIVVSQAFDFPSVYTRKKEVAGEKNKLSEFHYQLQRQEILFEARSIYLDQIYRNKLNSQYLQRKKSLETLVANYLKKMEKGESTIIEVNKAQLQLIELNKEIESNNAIIRQNNSRLSALNGGTTVEIKDTVYPAMQIDSSFDNYLKEIAQWDKVMLIIDQQNAIAMKEIDLNKAITLPQFELGYHYQGILGQRFNGVHAAVTIPLWEHKNTIKAAQSRSVALEFEKQAYEIELQVELKNSYDQHRILNQTLEEYLSVFTTFSNTELLLKALNMGQINAIEYFQELNYYYAHYNKFLETEHELYQVKNELLRFNL